MFRELCQACGLITLTWTRPDDHLPALQRHWPNCIGVSWLSFHPDGSLAGVAFVRGSVPPPFNPDRSLITGLEAPQGRT